MGYGANSVQQKLRHELEDYIRSQYFGKSPLLLKAIGERLDDEGLLYQKPYIESSPAYKSKPNGLSEADLPDWMKRFFQQLAQEKLGVFPAPFLHQIEALEHAVSGGDVFVSTGTGSGKTECFLWPMLAKLAAEAHGAPQTWNMRGVRVIVMYPMNALVSDQVSRLRRLMGDSEGKFVSIFRKFCGEDARRPQFGMYTGRTPYPGPEPIGHEDRKLANTLERMSFPREETEKKYFEQLNREGKIPAKADMGAFLQGLRASQSRHIPAPEDAELITRLEMQQFCPDILITNYSMLEYMLLRPIEKRIWEETRTWLQENPANRLLLIIDEAHMYRGSSGGEVSFLIRRLLKKLKIDRSRVQFILTTASMPDQTEEDREAVKRFAHDLTAADDAYSFRYIKGERERLTGYDRYDIDAQRFAECTPWQLEGEEGERLDALNRFWTGVKGSEAPFASVQAACEWMYAHLMEYRPFNRMIEACRGGAVSLRELTDVAFMQTSEKQALKYIEVMLAMAPLARASSGAVLFPARMHMLFRGIRGVYACTNPDCPHRHEDHGLTLGEIFLSDGQLVCPHCGGMVYELYNDRRCGALFLKGYVLESDIGSGAHTYLWHNSGEIIDRQMKEIHLYLSPDGFSPRFGRTANPIKPCYLDTKSGFVDFRDDSLDGMPGIRKLFYCEFSAKGRPEVITFPTCPHCGHQLSQTQLSSFSTRGNQSFFNLGCVSKVESMTARK